MMPNSNEQLRKMNILFDDLKRQFSAPGFFKDTQDQEFFLLMYNISSTIMNSIEIKQDGLYDPYQLCIDLIDAVKKIQPYISNPSHIIPEFVTFKSPMTVVRETVGVPSEMLKNYNGRAFGTTFFIIDPSTYLLAQFVLCICDLLIRDCPIAFLKHPLISFILIPKIKGIAAVMEKRCEFYEIFTWISINFDNTVFSNEALIEIIEDLEKRMVPTEQAMFRETLNGADKRARKDGKPEQALLYRNFVTQHASCLLKIKSYLTDIQKNKVELSEELQELKKTAQVEWVDVNAGRNRIAEFLYSEKNIRYDNARALRERAQEKFPKAVRNSTSVAFFLPANELNQSSDPALICRTPC